MHMILWPAVITLAITLLRLVGELQGWSKTLFNPTAGGGFALIGISWLPPIFGAYFAWRLAREGKGPGNGWKVAGIGLLCIGLLLAVGIGTARAGASRTIQLLVWCLGALLVSVFAVQSWKALGRMLLAYALAARIPVALIMLVAIFGKWGTHYDVLPPDPPPTLVSAGPLEQWFWIGLLPQMTIWIAQTVLFGMLVGGITAAFVKPKPAA